MSVWNFSWIWSLSYGNKKETWCAHASCREWAAFKWIVLATIWSTMQDWFCGIEETFLFRLRHTYGGFDKIKIIQGSKFQDAQLETGAKKHPCLTWHNHLMEESGFKDRLQITSGYTDKYEQLLVELETLLANLGILWCVSVRMSLAAL